MVLLQFINLSTVVMVNVVISCPCKHLVPLTDINECDSNPCENSGTCNNHINFYNCSCPPGYEGVNCEIGQIHYILLYNIRYVGFLKSNGCGAVVDIETVERITISPSTQAVFLNLNRYLE
jgi:hypothetical protein